MLVAAHQPIMTDVLSKSFPLVCRSTFAKVRPWLFFFLTTRYFCIFVFTAAQSLKRLRTDASSPVQHDLHRVVGEQAAMIESLKKDKSTTDASLASLKTDHEKISKENHILRRAVGIQQDRHNHAENEIKMAQQYRTGAEDQIKKLEQVILTLRYHLQTKQPSFGNDFMGHRPPDVY
jgi:septal ring factor EnvC (AmiA/AmiB activator)